MAIYDKRHFRDQEDMEVFYDSLVSIPKARYMKYGYLYFLRHYYPWQT